MAETLDMDAPALEPLLAFFGIAQCQNEQGELGWTINISTGESGARTHSAMFDKQAGVWRLGTLSKGELQCLLPHRGKRLVRRDRLCSQPLEKDWTDDLHFSAHSELLFKQDWAETPLGPLESWPRCLQLYTKMLLSDTRPASIFWGPQRIAIYNEGLIPVLGDLHPILLGHSFEEIMPSVWDFFRPLFHDIESDQHGFSRNGLELYVMRHGYLEETYWDGGLISLSNDDGDYGGVYFSWTESTRTVLRDRRSNIVNQLGISSLATTRSYWQHVRAVFAQHPRDVTMAIMYSMDENAPVDGHVHLEHTIGVGITYTAAPHDIDVTSDSSVAALAPLLLRARETCTDFLVIDLSKENIEPSIVENVAWQGFGEPSRHLVVIALKNSSLVRGYVVLGLNPRRAFDEDHEEFVTDLARQLKETMSSTVSHHRSSEREKKLTTELSESERRASRMAEIVPVGIYELAADGSLLWANSQFFEIMGAHDHRETSAFAWGDYVDPEDHVRANEKMAKSLMQGIKISDDLRLRRTYHPPGFGADSHSTDEPFWIMYSASPNLDADGSVYSLTGSITDISHLKWAEQLQIRNAAAAQKERKIQEEFIDITSHELRNPLSAITQSGDDIMLSLRDAERTNDVGTLMDIIKSNVEAAESILFCAAHQKRIVDDVLTLGKLDSKLLAMSPTSFHTQDLVDQAMQMFTAEFGVNKITVQTTVDLLEGEDGRPTVCGDSSRLLQVLVNLVTNAIKFTKTQPERSITIRHGLSYAVPSASLFGRDFGWFTTGLSRPDLTQEPEYGQGAPVYLYFAVTDSGEGIPRDALGMIFAKFEQAERRTYTKYGGSGLGLYISRELTELQGGHIGLESAVGVGSTFAFYAKIRLSDTQAALKNPRSSAESSPTKMASGCCSLALNNGRRLSNVAPSGHYNILLVEDNLLNQAVLAKQLRKAGCKVQTSDNGGEAVDTVLLQHGQPTEYGTPAPEQSLPYFDCILMDWEMPVCDGLQATMAIRRIELHQKAARNLIIGVTANARAEQLSKAMAAGMDLVVPKPFRVADLLSKISGLMSTR